MIDILRAAFKKLPKPGDIYVFDHGQTDPWGGKKKHTVEVLDTASGWVRYKFCGSSFYTDERMTRSTFHFCYVKMPSVANKLPTEAQP